MKEQKKDTMTKNKYCVYFHYTSSTNELFYVGYGTKKRPNDMGSRSKEWFKIVKEKGIKVEIFENRYNMSLKEAYTLEIQFIKQFGRVGLDVNGILINKSTGGRSGAEGSTHIMPIWLKNKLIKINRGKILSKETRNKISNSRKGITFSEEHCNKISKAKKNYIYSKDRNIKIGDKLRGKNNIKLQKPILQYDLEGKFIKEWGSIRDGLLSLNKGVGDGIGACCRGKQKTAYGFKWNYKYD